MQVVLRSDLAGLGKKGDIIEVAAGHARNYLLPRGYAIVATQGIKKQAASMRRGRDLKDAKDREAAETVARALVPQVVTVTARAGPEGRLFGSVTALDVVTAVADQTGIQLDRRSIQLDEPIRSLGSHEVPVRLHTDVQFRVTLEVNPQ